jgi:hypothetical protein
MTKATYNAFQWRTIAVIIRGHLGLSHPVSTERAMKIATETHDPLLLAKIKQVGEHT